MSIKEGKQTTEWKGLIGIIVACLTAMIPVIIKAVPEGSAAYVILGALGAGAAAYITYNNGRAKVKAEDLATEGKRVLAAGAKGLPPDPR